MPITVNDGGVLRTLGEISVNDGGVLKKLNTVHANDGGVLRQIFSAGTPISNYGVGSVVKIKENGVAVNYIIVHKGLPSTKYDSSCDGIWVLRKTYHSQRAWWSESSHYNDYENSGIKRWLDGAFLNAIDEEIRAAIKTVKIPFKKGWGSDPTGVQSGANGLSCKVFLLSGYEVGFTGTNSPFFPRDGARLSYFADAEKRIDRGNGVNGVDWWLRSPNTDYTGIAWFVNSSGSHACAYTDNTSNKVRPAFILPNTVKVDNNGNLIV